MFHINFLAIIISSFAFLAIGFIWYGPLFGKLWMRLVDKSSDEIKESNTIALYSITAFMGAVITSAVYGAITHKMGITRTYEFMMVGIWLWFGFYASMTWVNGGISSKSRHLWIIEATYWLACAITTSLVHALLS